MNKQKEEEAFLLWLYCIEGLGRKKIKDLLNICKKAKNVYALKEEFIDQLGFLTQKDKNALKEAKRDGDILKKYEQLKEKGIVFVPWSSKIFPEKLKQIPDAPYGIFYNGEMPDPNVPSVAVIGARQCTEYGRYIASKLGSALADEGIQVISGMARGIDSIAQSAAMEAGGKTFAVLGCGVDVCYPPECTSLFRQLMEKGGILSEYPPGTEPKASYFPRRNRIISGLSDAVVVVEARERSGTLITVDMALEQGREVYVVPGRITDPLSFGCNHLIRQGAGIVGDFRELAREVRELHENQWLKKASKVLNEIKKAESQKEELVPESYQGILQKFTPLQKEIYQIIYLEGKNIQQIYTELNQDKEVDIATVSEELFCMEKMQLINYVDGFYFARFKTAKD